MFLHCAFAHTLIINLLLIVYLWCISQRYWRTILSLFHFFPSRHAMIKIKPFLAIALNVASKREEFHPLWVLHLLCLNCAQCCSWTMTWWQRLILWMKLPIFLEIQFRLLPQDGNLTLFHHLTKEPKKDGQAKKYDSGGFLWACCWWNIYFQRSFSTINNAS